MDYFRQCSFLETNPCVLYFATSLTLEEAVTAAKYWNLIAYFPDLKFRYGLKKSMHGVYKPSIDCPFIRGMVENNCTLGQIQPWPR